MCPSPSHTFYFSSSSCFSFLSSFYFSFLYRLLLFLLFLVSLFPLSLRLHFLLIPVSCSPTFPFLHPHSPLPPAPSPPLHILFFLPLPGSLFCHFRVRQYGPYIIEIENWRHLHKCTYIFPYFFSFFKINLKREKTYLKTLQ